MSKKQFTLLLIFAIFCHQSFAQNSQTLSLDDYIAQVKGQNLSYEASNQNAEAFEKLKAKAKLLTAFNFFATTQSSFTEQNQALQIFRYSSVYNRNNQIGISQTADFGLNTKIYYSLNQVTYKGLNTTNSKNPELAASNYQGTPVIEVSLPIWKNRFGASTRASKDVIFYNNEYQSLLAKSISINSLVGAEQSYWNLVATRRAVEIQKSALKSAKQILDYVQKKERMNLGEKGDVLQAKALLESRRLSLQQAENDEKLAARDFNKQRFINSFEVSEKLNFFDFSQLKKLNIPKVRVDDRFDIKASQATMKAAVANAKIDEENSKPDVSIYGAYSQNQIKSGVTEALSAIPDRTGRYAMIGVKLSVPVNFYTTSEIKSGAQQSASAARINYRQKIFEQETDWQNLIQNLEISKKNLELAQQIESAQKLKLENERNLLQQGRTTTYQILLFEQDYLNSQLNTVQIAYKMLFLVAQIRLYSI